MRIELSVPKEAVAKLLELCRAEPKNENNGNKEGIKEERKKSDDEDQVGPLGSLGIRQIRIKSQDDEHVFRPRLAKPPPTTSTTTPTASSSRIAEGSMETSPLLINLLRSKQHHVEASRRQTSGEEDKSLKLKLRLPLEKKRGSQQIEEPPKKLPKLILSMKERTVKLKEKGVNAEASQKGGHVINKSGFEGLKQEHGEASGSVNHAVRTLKLPPGISLNEVPSSNRNASTASEKESTSKSATKTSSVLSSGSSGAKFVSSGASGAKLVSLSSEGANRLLKVPSSESRRGGNEGEKRDKIEVILLGSKANKEESINNSTTTKSNKVEELADRLVRGALKRKLAAASAKSEESNDKETESSKGADTEVKTEEQSKTGASTSNSGDASSNEIKPLT